ncbi:HAD hydrolase-like protein [Candidatus Woesearchaeota archaeon]|nr:HAD hydrolase-like protein [Candidatus Woesearchaeota archaeon]
MAEYHIAKNINVGLDFDGVLAHGINAKVRYAKEWFGVGLKDYQTKKAAFNELMKKLGKDVNYKHFMDRLNEEHIMEYEVPKGCIDILKKLYSEGFRFAIVTSRNKHDYPYAKIFVEHYFKGIIRYMHNTRDEPKDVFVRRLRIRAYVDDDISKLIQLEDTPSQLIYYRQRENKDVNIPFSKKLSIFRSTRYHEVKDWNEFYEVLRQLKEMHEAVCWKYDIKNDSFHLKEIDDYCRELSSRRIKGIIEEYKRKARWH